MDFVAGPWHLLPHVAIFLIVSPWLWFAAHQFGFSQGLIESLGSASARRNLCDALLVLKGLLQNCRVLSAQSDSKILDVRRKFRCLT